jgi:hypothetical protein
MPPSRKPATRPGADPGRAFLPEPPVVPPSPRPPVRPPEPGCSTLPVTRVPKLPSLPTGRGRPRPK